VSHRDHYTQAAAERIAAALGLDPGAVQRRATELENALAALDDEPGTWQTGELLLLALDGLLTEQATPPATSERPR
jgi:hypothetical protein